jgi:hypothetical protein
LGTYYKYKGAGGRVKQRAVRVKCLGSDYEKKIPKNPNFESIHINRKIRWSYKN